jgi:broad specificity phosphatase PhoE
MGKLLVMRHLETQGNREKRFCSGDWDVDESILPGQAINPSIAQAVYEVGECVLATTGLRRTQETATLLATALGNNTEDFVVVPELQERFAGELAGMSWEDIQVLFPDLQVPSDLWAVHAPERGLETTDQFLQRITRGLDKVSLFRQTVVLVAHAGSIKGIEAVLSSRRRGTAEILQSSSPENGAIFSFSLEERAEGKWRKIRSALHQELRRMNTECHGETDE